MGWRLLGVTPTGRSANTGISEDSTATSSSVLSVSAQASPGSVLRWPCVVSGVNLSDYLRI